MSRRNSRRTQPRMMAPEGSTYNGGEKLRWNRHLIGAPKTAPTMYIQLFLSIYPKGVMCLLNRVLVSLKGSSQLHQAHQRLLLMTTLSIRIYLLCYHFVLLGLLSPFVTLMSHIYFTFWRLGNTKGGTWASCRHWNWDVAICNKDYLNRWRQRSSAQHEVWLDGFCPSARCCDMEERECHDQGRFRWWRE